MYILGNKAEIKLDIEQIKLRIRARNSTENDR
jgi:hypothetical protein